MKKPIKPFEPVSSTTIPQGDKWIAQIKWDGVRILYYLEDGEVYLYNRKGHERTAHFPEVSEPAFIKHKKSVILDGEVISLGEHGFPSFHHVMKRDGIRNISKVKTAMEEVPVHYMIFDILYADGEWLTGLPLSERLLILQETVSVNETIRLVDSVLDASALYKIIESNQMEGIVCKDLESRYEIGGKQCSWQKIKHYLDLIAVVGGVSYSGKTVNSLLIGLYDGHGALHYISHVGSGRLKQEDWKQLTEIFQQIETETCPFSSKPKTSRTAKWVRPVLTVKIQYMEWPANHSLRQPSILSFVSAEPKDCTFENEVNRNAD
ncbi:MAG: DNA ligase [Bacillus sp. (in: firmicutes)]